MELLKGSSKHANNHIKPFRYCECLYMNTNLLSESYDKVLRKDLIIWYWKSISYNLNFQAIIQILNYSAKKVKGKIFCVRKIFMHYALENIIRLICKLMILKRHK